MSESEENLLPPNQQRAAQLMAMGDSVGQIAVALSIVPDTLYRWKRNPLFMQEIRRLQAERFADSSARLQLMVENALSLLEKKQASWHNNNDVRISLAVLRLVGVDRILGAPAKPMPAAHVPPAPPNAPQPSPAPPEAAAGDA